MNPVYKFVELSTVTDDQLERVVNEWVAKGWRLDVIHFAMREASHRPAMAFVQFIRPPELEAEAEEAEEEAPLRSV